MSSQQPNGKVNQTALNNALLLADPYSCFTVRFYNPKSGKWHTKNLLRADRLAADAV